MDSRRQLALCVIERGMSLSQACREFGVSRPTGRKWVARALLDGIENISELPKGPRVVVNKISEATEASLLGLKKEYEHWGAKKLVQLLEERRGIRISLRTGDRILARNGLVQHRATASEPIRFEREEPNMLLQMDFKGLPKRLPYALLTVIDDCSRMCHCLEPLKDKTGESVFNALWEIFGQVGLPECMLMDNGDCWGSGWTRSITAFESKLWRLGIKTTHGRPCHPQTQGKVERFHETVVTELGDSLFCEDPKQAKLVIEPFRDRYNWVRPHEALGGKRPAHVYVTSNKKRPASLPEASIPPGAVSRKVGTSGFISYKGNQYKIGKGLIGQPIGIKEAELGPMAYYATFPLAYLHEL